MLQTDIALVVKVAKIQSSQLFTDHYLKNNNSNDNNYKMAANCLFWNTLHKMSIRILYEISVLRNQM